MAAAVPNPRARKKRPDGDTRALVLNRHLKGIGARAIAEELGVTRQAVYQHLGTLRRQGLIDQELAS